MAMATTPSTYKRPLRHKLLIGLALLVPFFLTSLLTATHLIRTVWIRLLLHPFLIQRHRNNDTPKKYGMHFEDVVLSTKEGLLLSAWYISAPKKSDRTLILCHGVNRNKAFFLPTASFLHKAGYNLLMLDMRSHGKSEGGLVSFGYYEQYDVDAAIEHLKKRGRHLIKHLGIVAHSMGAAMSVFAAARRREIKAMVLICCYADIEWNMDFWITKLGHLPYWPFVPLMLKSFRKELVSDITLAGPMHYLHKLKIPLFFIHSENDQVTDPRSSQKLYDAAREPKELWYVPHAKHEGFYDAAPEEFKKRVLTFFTRAL